MTTRLAEPLRREVEIDGEPYTVLLTPHGLRLSRKRFRGGLVMTWKALRDLGELEGGHPPAGAG